jgi:hypothetical protein
VFRGEIKNHTRVFEWKSPSSSRLRKARQVKKNIKSLLIIFFDIKVIVRKEFVLAGHTFNSAYCCDVYSDCLKMYEDFALSFGYSRMGVTSCKHTASDQEIFYYKQHDHCPCTHPTCLTWPLVTFPLFPKLKIPPF